MKKKAEFEVRLTVKQSKFHRKHLFFVTNATEETRFFHFHRGLVCYTEADLPGRKQTEPGLFGKFH